MIGILLVIIIGLGFYIWADKRRQKREAIEERVDWGRTVELVVRARRSHPKLNRIDAVHKLREEIYKEIVQFKAEGKDFTNLKHDLILLINEEQRLWREDVEKGKQFEIVGEMPVLSNRNN